MTVDSFYLMQATVLFDDGTGECMVHAEGISVLGLLRRPGIDFTKICDLVEQGCRQYGAVRYDSYFSHWNRMDALNNTTNDDEAHCVDGIDLQNIHLPAPLPTQPGGSAGIGRVLPNNYSNSAKIDSVENFYKIFSPAHTVEKELETYLNQKCSSPLLKLQVKIIPEKKGSGQSAMTGNRSSKSKENVSSSSSSTSSGVKENDSENTAKITTTTNTSSNKDTTSSSSSSSIIQAGKTNIIDLTDADVTIKKIGPYTETVESLLRNLSQHDDAATLTARNIKVQENNDERPYSISFLSLPTLDLKRLAVEAVSVTYMGDREIREEAWEDLKTLRLASNLRNKSVFNQLPVNP